MVFDIGELENAGRAARFDYEKIGLDLSSQFFAKAKFDPQFDRALLFKFYASLAQSAYFDALPAR